MMKKIFGLDIGQRIRRSTTGQTKHFNKPYRIKCLQYIFTLSFIVLILFTTRDHWREFDDIAKISAQAICWLSVLFICTAIANGYSLKIFINLFGIKLTCREWFGLECVRAFGNYLPLSAGLAYNAIYLKYRKELQFSKYVSFMAGNTVLMYLVFGCWGTFLLVLSESLFGKLDLRLLFVSMFFVGIGVGALIMPLPRLSKQNSIFRWIESARDGWELIKRSKGMLLKVVILHTVILFLISMRFYIIFEILGYHFGCADVVILAIMTSLITFTIIFPGNLGLRETVAGSVTKSFGISFNVGLMAGIIDRLVAMFWIFLLGIIFSFILTGEKKVLVEKIK